MINTIYDFLTKKEMDFLNLECKKGNWTFDAISEEVMSPLSAKPVFWHKNIFLTKATDLFYDKIKNGIKRNIIIDRLYVNGQARGQSGWWHVDALPPALNCFTIVYFLQEWKPEFGGHLVIKTDPISSILPEYNKAVLFNSTLEHMGMEPTIYCNSQRESIACKFRIVDE